MDFFFFLGILRLVLFNRLSSSFLWRTHLKPVHLTWSGTYTVVWKKIKGWFSYVLIWSICLWERFSRENTVLSALSVALVQVATACWDFSDVATHSSCPSCPGCFLSWGRSILQDSPQKGGVPSMWELSFFTFNGTQNGLWGRESNRKLFSWQT